MRVQPGNIAFPFRWGVGEIVTFMFEVRSDYMRSTWQHLFSLPMWGFLIGERCVKSASWFEDERVSLASPTVFTSVCLTANASTGIHREKSGVAVKGADGRARVISRCSGSESNNVQVSVSIADSSPFGHAVFVFILCVGGRNLVSTSPYLLKGRVRGGW
jgi:hypothetical protein